VSKWTSGKKNIGLTLVYKAMKFVLPELWYVKWAFRYFCA